MGAFKDSFTTSAKQKIAAIHSKMDKDLGFSEPSKVEKKKIRYVKSNSLTPLQCMNCKYKPTMDWVKRIRQQGEHFTCNDKVVST